MVWPLAESSSKDQNESCLSGMGLCDWEYRGDRTSPKGHTEYGTRAKRAKRISRERADGLGFKS